MDPWTKPAWEDAYSEYPDVVRALRIREQQPGAMLVFGRGSDPGVRWVSFMRLRYFCQRNAMRMFVDGAYVCVQFPNGSTQHSFRVDTYLDTRMVEACTNGVLARWSAHLKAPKMKITTYHQYRDCLIGGCGEFYVRSQDYGASFRVALRSGFDRWCQHPDVSSEEASKTLGVDVNDLAIWATQT